MGTLKSSSDIDHAELVPWHWFVLLVLAASWLLQANFTGLNLWALLYSSILLMIAWFLAYLKGSVFNPFKQSDGLPWLMLGIVCWVITGLFLSLAPYRSWLYGWVWLAMPTVFFMIVQIQNLKMAHLKLIIPLLGSLFSLVSIYQFHIMFDRYGYRAPGTLLDANSFAGLLNLLLLPTMAWAMQARSKYRNLYWLALFFMTGGICATGSRAGMLLMLAGIMILTLLTWRKGGEFKGGLLALAIAGGWVVESLLLSHGQLAHRINLTSLHDPSVSARFLIWDACWRLIQDAHWWGTGMGTFALLYPQTRSLLETETSGGYVHSDPLQLLLEGGWPMLLLVTLVILYAAVYLRKLWQTGGMDDMPLFAIGLAILLAATHACVNFNFYNVSVGSLIGLYSALLYLHLNRADMSCRSLGVMRLGMRVCIGFLAGVCIILLVLDDQALSLQQPLLDRGLQAVFTVNQCDKAEVLDIWRPSMPALAMAKGVCALKKNNCSAVHQALDAFHDAVGRSPLQPELYAFIAQLDLMAGVCIANHESIARVQLLKALDKNPAYFPARYLLYNMDSKHGDRAKAQAWISDGLHYGMDFRNRASYDALIRKF